MDCSPQLDDPTARAAKKNGGNSYFSPKKSSTASLNLPQYASCTDLEMSDEDNNETDASTADTSNSNRIPAPRQLTLEALQNKSLVVGWNPPPHFPSSKVECFQVIVDGNVEATVKPTSPEYGKQLRATVQVLSLAHNSQARYHLPLKWFHRGITSP